MWVISGGIVLGTISVLAGPGLEGVPGEWVGLVVAATFAVVAFALGFYE
jgi:hypothetical protein